MYKTEDFEITKNGDTYTLTYEDVIDSVYNEKYKNDIVEATYQAICDCIDYSENVSKKEEQMNEYMSEYGFTDLREYIKYWIKELEAKNEKVDIYNLFKVVVVDEYWMLYEKEILDYAFELYGDYNDYWD